MDALSRWLIEPIQRWIWRRRLLRWREEARRLLEEQARAQREGDKP